jgi:hypothetical protein
VGSKEEDDAISMVQNLSGEIEYLLRTACRSVVRKPPWKFYLATAEMSKYMSQEETGDWKDEVFFLALSGDFNFVCTTD